MALQQIESDGALPAALRQLNEGRTCGGPSNVEKSRLVKQGWIYFIFTKALIKRGIHERLSGGDSPYSQLHTSQHRDNSSFTTTLERHKHTISEKLI